MNENRVVMSQQQQPHSVEAEKTLRVWMEDASGVVQRYKLRGNVLPQLSKSQEEDDDWKKLDAWKKSLDGKPSSRLPPHDVLLFLDSEMMNWRGNSEEQEAREEQESLAKWREVVGRYRSRNFRFPLLRKGTGAALADIHQENADAIALRDWRNSIQQRQSTSSLRPSDFTIMEFMDGHLPGWKEVNLTEEEVGVVSAEMEVAIGMHERFLARGSQMPQQHLIPSAVPNGDTEVNNEKELESRDATQLNEWKQSLLTGNRKNQCLHDVCQFLDERMPLWREKAEKQQIFNRKAMMFAEGIVARYEARGKIMPVRSKECKADPSRAQEYRDAAKLNDWKQSLKGNKTKTVCCEEVRAFLDERVPQWREISKDTHHDPMAKAVEIVQRYHARGNVMPREWREHRHDPVRAEEYKDASKLRNWKRALKGNGTHNCPDAVRDFLDLEMPNWRKDVRKQYCNPMDTARDIVERYNLRGKVLPRHFSSNRKDPERQQEYKDAKKLYDWKQGLKGLRFYRCSAELKEYLDANLPGWNDGVYSKASLLAEAKIKGVSNHGGSSLGTTVSGVMHPDNEENVLTISLKRSREEGTESENVMVQEGMSDNSGMDHQQQLLDPPPPSKIPRVMETKEV